MSCMQQAKLCEIFLGVNKFKLIVCEYMYMEKIECLYCVKLCT